MSYLDNVKHSILQAKDSLEISLEDFKEKTTTYVFIEMSNLCKYKDGIRCQRDKMYAYRQCKVAICPTMQGFLSASIQHMN